MIGAPGRAIHISRAASKIEIDEIADRRMSNDNELMINIFNGCSHL